LGASQRAAREAERLPGARGRVSVVVHLGLDGRQPARDAAQLRVQLVDERRHLAATQLAVQDARQVADDATPLVVLDTTDVNGRSHTHTLRVAAPPDTTVVGLPLNSTRRRVNTNDVKRDEILETETRNEAKPSTLRPRPKFWHRDRSRLEFWRPDRHK